MMRAKKILAPHRHCHSSQSLAATLTMTAQAFQKSSTVALSLSASVMPIRAWPMKCLWAGTVL